TWFAVGGHLSEGPVARGGEVGQAPPGEHVGGRLGRRARVAFGGQPSRAAGVDGRDRFGGQAGGPVVDQARPLGGAGRVTGLDVAGGDAGPVDGGQRRGATGQQDQQGLAAPGSLLAQVPGQAVAGQVVDGRPATPLEGAGGV